MSLKANYEFLFFGRDENSFLENYAFDLFQDHGEKSGQIFVNLEIQNNPVDAERLAAVIFETMREVFFEDVNADPYERFEIALKEVNLVLDEFRRDKSSSYLGDINAIVAAVVGNTLFLSQSGEAEAYLIRKRFVSVVSEGLSDEDADDVFTNIASGEIEAGDFVLFASTRLLRYIGQNDLARAVNPRSVSASLSEVQDVISTEILGRVGMTAILFNKMMRAEEALIRKHENSATETIFHSDKDHVHAETETVSGEFTTGLAEEIDYELPRKKSKTRTNALYNVKKIFSGMRLGRFGGRNGLLVVLVVFMVVLVAGIFVAKGRSEERARLAGLEEQLEDVEMKISEAETQGVTDKSAAVGLLDQAYEEALSVLNSGDFRERAHMALGRIEEARDRIDNVQRVEEPTTVVDLTEVKSDINALGFVDLDDQLFIYDENSVMELILDNVSEPVTIDEDEVLVEATGFDSRGSLVFLTRSGKLVEYRDGTVTFMDTDEGAFRKGVAIDDWGSRIYLLAPDDNQIWKYNYQGTLGKFSDADPYLADNDGVDFSGAVDLAIDASIFVVSNDGGMSRMLSGEKLDFFINNPPFDVYDSPNRIYTSENLDEVYVLDPKAKRLFEFLKDDRTNNVIYRQQYLFDERLELRDLYIDEEADKVYVLTSDSVLEI